jgi:hypothetical protein
MFEENQIEYWKCLLIVVSEYFFSHLSSENIHTHAQNYNFIFKIEEGEIGRACSIHRGYKKYIIEFVTT